MQSKEANEEKRIAIVENYLRDEISQHGAANEAQVSVAAFRRWVIRYQNEGPAGLKMPQENRIFQEKPNYTLFGII